jgi:hypothetical protein
MNKDAEKYLQQLIDKKIPKELQLQYGPMVGAMKAGFYAGIEFARLLHKKKVK